MKAIAHRIVDLLRPPLAVRLAAIMVILVCGAMAALGWILSSSLSNNQRRQADDLCTTMTRYLARIAREATMADDRLSMKIMVTGLVTGDSVVGAEILSPNGEPLVNTGLVYSEVNSSISKGIKGRFTEGKVIAQWPWQFQGVRHISYAAPIRFKSIIAGYAVVTFNRNYLDRNYQLTIDIILYATLITMALASFPAYIISRRISDPVRKIMHGLEAYQEGDFKFRFHDRRRDEYGQLMEALNQMAAGIVRKGQLEEMLNRYLSPQVVGRIMGDVENITLGGRRIRGSVIFADVVGFTALSENMEPEGVAGILNHYFGLISRACEICHGMVDKYMGDCAMLVFGALEDDPDHCFHAVFCSVLINLIIAEENLRRKQEGLITIEFRLGINTGTMLAGNMGSKNRMDYTVVGDAVNLASRLCGVSGPGMIIISEEIYHRPNIQQRFKVVKHQSIRLRGIEDEVPTFKVLGIAEYYKDRLLEKFQVVTGYNPKEVSL